MTTKLVVKDIVPALMTADDGLYLFDEINASFLSYKPVNVSFEGISGINTSFVNGAFVTLLAIYPMDFIKRNLNIVDSNRQINRLIKDRLAFEHNAIQLSSTSAHR